MVEVVQYNQPATRLSWRIVSYMGLSVGLCCWQIRRLLVTSQVGLGEWRSMLLSPCITLIPATMATLLISALGDDRVTG